MRYLCAGIFAEGRSDYDFLIPLVDQLLPVAVSALQHQVEIGETVGIDAPRRFGASRREERIAAAIDEYWDQCTLFIIHTDGAGDHARATRERVLPGRQLALQTRPTAAIVSCVPVREVESWLLADPGPFARLIRSTPDLPKDPEAISDPKLALKDLLATRSGGTLTPTDLYTFFGRNVSLEALRTLPAFRRFEAELNGAVVAAFG